MCAEFDSMAAARKRGREVDGDEAKLAASVFGDVGLEDKLGGEGASGQQEAQGSAWESEDLFAIDRSGAAEVGSASGTEDGQEDAPAPVAAGEYQPCI